MKLADFGLAQRMEQNIKLHLKCGTPGYMAPEVLRNKPYNEKADIYSCGSILYFMYLYYFCNYVNRLCGSSPFEGKTREEIMLVNSVNEIKFSGSKWSTIFLIKVYNR